MTFPLVLLAGLSLFAGGLLHYNGNWGSLIQGLAPAGAETANNVVLLASIAALIAGVGLAASMYSYGSLDPAALSKRFPGIHAFLTRRYADDVYAWIIKNTVNPLALLAAKLDYQVLDQGLVDGVGRLGRRVAGFKSWVDDKIVDGIFVNGWGTMSQSAGILVRRLQSGAAQFYLLAAAFGLSLLVLWAARAFR
jgi:NADH:ubiquinone oxidoreductase subunit 5 (subunit L)/multisubunit Na+/H+ antiporter MnhA subunit